MQDDNPAASAARELKAAAREALRMGSLWTHHAIHWVDERRNEMNNRNREQEQRERERAERNRYSTSGYGSDEGDYGPGQYGRQNVQPGLSEGRRAPQPQARDRDVQGDYSSGGWLRGRGSQQGYGREGGTLHSQSRDESDARGGYASYEQFGSRPQYAPGSAQQRGSQGYGAQGHGAGSETFDPQDLPQDYSPGNADYGSPGFGAQGSRGSGDYERQSRYGDRKAHGGLSQQDYGHAGMSEATSYRGRGPKNYTRSDERIREDLNERLTDSDDVDASNLTVEVSNGIATLKGSVDERWMKHRAEDLAESCSGVRDVDNQIRVQPHAGSHAISASATSGGSKPGGSSPDFGSSLGASGAATGSPSAGSGSSASGSSTTGKTGGSSTA